MVGPRTAILCSGAGRHWARSLTLFFSIISAEESISCCAMCITTQTDLLFTCERSCSTHHSAGYLHLLCSWSGVCSALFLTQINVLSLIAFGKEAKVAQLSPQKEEWKGGSCLWSNRNLWYSWMWVLLFWITLICDASDLYLVPWLCLTPWARSWRCRAQKKRQGNNFIWADYPFPSCVHLLSSPGHMQNLRRLAFIHHNLCCHAQHKAELILSCHMKMHIYAIWNLAK